MTDFLIFDIQMTIYTDMQWHVFLGGGEGSMVLNAIFNNISVISWRPVLLVEETGVSGENHRSAACHWQTLSQKVVSSTPRQSGIRHVLQTLHVLVITLNISRAKVVASSARPDRYDNNGIYTETYNTPVPDLTAMITIESILRHTILQCQTWQLC